MADVNWGEWLLQMVVFVIAITIHECAHAVAAVHSGDDTPRIQGRVSLNPIDHLSPMGTLMMGISSILGVGFGWGKPVEYQPMKLRHPRWDTLKIAIVGPISNVLQACVFAGVIRFLAHAGTLSNSVDRFAFLFLGVQINLVLAFFNMIPIPPLDGSKVLSSWLSVEAAQLYEGFMRQFGLIVFILIAVTGVAGKIIQPLVNFFTAKLTGIVTSP